MRGYQRVVSSGTRTCSAQLSAAAMKHEHPAVSNHFESRVARDSILPVPTTGLYRVLIMVSRAQASLATTNPDDLPRMQVPMPGWFAARTPSSKPALVGMPVNSVSER